MFEITLSAIWVVITWAGALLWWGICLGLGLGAVGFAWDVDIKSAIRRFLFDW